MATPLVGVTSYDTDARWGIWDAPAAVAARTYLDWLIQVGVEAVVLAAGFDPAAIVNRLDGLLLTGGPDVEPGRYGAAPLPTTDPAGPRRDDFELGLARAALAADLPLLGICRGAQVLNVVRGGTLHQHLPDVVGHEAHAPGGGRFGDVEVIPAPGTLAHRALLGNDQPVRCFHHQAVDRVGSGLVVSARSSDGTVEAIEDQSARFVLGVQWHPERGSHPGVFEVFADALSSRP